MQLWGDLAGRRDGRVPSSTPRTAGAGGVVVRAWAEAEGGAVLPERTPSLTVGEPVGLLEE